MSAVNGPARVAVCLLLLMWAASATAAGVSGLSAPSNVVATGGDASASLTWTAPTIAANGPVTGYFVTADDVTTGDAAAPDGTGGSTSAAIAGLHPGDVYTFTVAARTTDGMGPPSSPSNRVVPTASAAAASTSNSGQNPTVTGGQITVSGSGSGAITLNTYGAAAEPGLPGGSDYLQVSESGLQAVTVQICGVPSEGVLDWWATGGPAPAWTPVAPAAALSGGCLSFTTTADSDPTIDTFYGATFAISSPQVMAIPALRVGSDIVAVHARSARVKLTCTAAACHGSVTLTTQSHGRTVTLGRAEVSLAAGARTTVTVKLGTAARRVIAAAKHHRLLGIAHVALSGGASSSVAIELR